MCFHVQWPPQPIWPLESDGGPFNIIDSQKKSKKPHTNQEDPLDAQYQFETSIHIIFKKPAKCGTKFNAAVHMKKLIMTMKLYDPALSLLALDHQMTYHPNNNDFPKTEEGFKALFFLYLASTHPLALCNQVTVECILCSLITLKELKNKTNKTPPSLSGSPKTSTSKLIAWDMVSSLTSPHITHHTSLKELLSSHLSCTPTIKPKEAIALNSSAKDHYHCTMDITDDSEAFVLKL